MSEGKLLVLKGSSSATSRQGYYDPWEPLDDYQVDPRARAAGGFSFGGIFKLDYLPSRLHTESRNSRHPILFPRNTESASRCPRTATRRRPPLATKTSAAQSMAEIKITLNPLEKCLYYD